MHARAVLAYLDGFIAMNRLALANRLRGPELTLGIFRRQIISERVADHLLRIVAVDQPGRLAVDVGPTAPGIDGPDEIVGGFDQVAETAFTFAQTFFDLLVPGDV